MATAAVTNDFVSSTTIVSDDVDTNFTDLVSFLNSNVVHVDGSKAMTGALALGTNKITGLAAASANGDALRWEQFNGHAHTGSTISGLDAADTTAGVFNATRIPNLAASKITSGTFAIGRIPTGTSSSTVSLGNHVHTIYHQNGDRLLSSGGSVGAPGMGFNSDQDSGVYNISGYTGLSHGGSAVIVGNGSTEVYIDGMAVGSQANVSASGTQLYRASSSRRYKINIEIAALDLGVIDDLEVVEFTYDPEVSPDTKRHTFLIAEEVYAAGGERYIARNENDQIEDIEDRALIALLISTVKDLRDRVALLEE